MMVRMGEHIILDIVLSVYRKITGDAFLKINHRIIITVMALSVIVENALGETVNTEFCIENASEYDFSINGADKTTLTMSGII